MHRHTNSNAILYVDLQLLKQSYKLAQPGAVKWQTLRTELKLTPPKYCNQDGEQKEEEISCNGFSKVKQLFRKKQNCLGGVNEREKEQMGAEQHQSNEVLKVQTPVNRFEFDSFGAKKHTAETPVAILTRNQPKDVDQIDPGWNSGSFELNFGTKFDKELSLSECMQSTIQNRYSSETEQLMQNSIKQFCFKLSQEPYIDLQTTPIKKWSDNKKARKLVTQPAHNATANKSILKQQIQNCMEMIETVQDDQLSNSMVNSTHQLLQNVKSNLSNIKRKLIFEDKENNPLCYRQDHSQTLKIFDSNAPVQPRRSAAIRQKITAPSKNHRKSTLNSKPFKV